MVAGVSFWDVLIVIGKGSMRDLNLVRKSGRSLTEVFWSHCSVFCARKEPRFHAAIFVQDPLRLRTIERQSST